MSLPPFKGCFDVSSLFLLREEKDLSVDVTELRSSNTGNNFSQPVAQHCCIANWKGLLPVLPSSLSTCHTTNFDVASWGSLRKSCVVIGRECVFVSANKMACWPPVVSFSTSLVNAVLGLCNCFYKTVWWKLNFWHNSSRALDLRSLFLYSGPQVSASHGSFSSSLHKSFLWASDIFSLINSQSWVSTFSTSTTSAMFTSCPNRICPRSSARLLTIFPAFLVRENWPITSVVKCSKLWCKW